VSRGSETIEVRPAAATDSWGNPVAGPAPASFKIKFCKIWPRTLPEDQTTVIDGLNISTPPTKKVIPVNARIFARGVEWDVDGAIGDYRNARGVRKTLIFQTKVAV
jgi:hypothetical protein